MNKLSLGVDVGGTFTDLLLVDTEGKTFRTAKVSSTTDDQSRSFMEGIRKIGVSPETLTTIVHGTTVATNAILERKGARCGLITTLGFRDVLELGRRTRPHTYGMYGTFEAIIPRELRFEVTERVDAHGRIVTPLNEAEVREAISRLADLGAQALVIHFINSYINPQHEERCLELAKMIWPDDNISIGSRVLREFREFERGSTAALNAYVQPIVGRYLSRLEDDLQAQGFGQDLLVMQGNGGIMSAKVAVRQAVHMVMSGPAAGAIAAAETARNAGFANIISCDMGGTSFDVTVIRDSEPVISHEKNIDYSVPIRVPIVDIHTIGAGGGSIAHINDAGILQVGPESAGSDPGPICYGKGGTTPTVTDACVMLGLIDSSRVTGAVRPVDMSELSEQLESRIGRHLALDGLATAQAILDISANHLASAIRLVSIERGYDPRDFALFAFGGGGPLLAVRLAREIGVTDVLIPRYPGLTSALGCVIADVRHDFVQTINQPLDEVNETEIDEILSGQANAGEARIKAQGVQCDGLRIIHESDMLYLGQSHVLRIPVASPGFNVDTHKRNYADRYFRRFEISLPEMRPILMSLRSTVIGLRQPFDFRMLMTDAGRPGGPSFGTREIVFAGKRMQTNIVAREDLRPGDALEGPTIIEQSDTTTIIDPGAIARVDDYGNLVIKAGKS